MENLTEVVGRVGPARPAQVVQRCPESEDREKDWPLWRMTIIVEGDWRWTAGDEAVVG